MVDPANHLRFEAAALQARNKAFFLRAVDRSAGRELLADGLHQPSPLAFVCRGAASVVVDTRLAASGASA